MPVLESNRARRAIASREWIRCVVVCCLIAVWQWGHTAEVDTFTGLPYSLRDASAPLNDETQRRLERAVEQANQGALINRTHPHTKRPLFPAVKGYAYCHEGLLLDALEDELAGELIGQLEAFAQESEDVDRHSVTFQQSVYRDFSREETVTLARSARLAAVISVNGVFIGTDKLGHFLTEGLAYYQRMREPDSSVKDVLQLGELMESTYFGAVTTGVYSYADLAANVQGARFWIRLLHHQRLGPMEPGHGPQIVCRDHRWQLQGRFDWTFYVDPAWDEGRNCSMIRNQALLEKMQHAMGEQTCPREPLPMQLEERYGPFAGYVLNREGLQVLPAGLEPDTVMKEYMLQKNPDSWWRRWVVNTLARYYHEWEDKQQSPEPAKAQ